MASVRPRYVVIALAQTSNSKIFFNFKINSYFRWTMPAQQCSTSQERTAWTFRSRSSTLQWISMFDRKLLAAIIFECWSSDLPKVWGVVLLGNTSKSLTIRRISMLCGSRIIAYFQLWMATIVHKLDRENRRRIRRSSKHLKGYIRWCFLSVLLPLRERNVRLSSSCALSNCFFGATNRDRNG